LFQQLGCVSCHLTDGSGRGPSLAGKYGQPEQLANGAAVVVDVLVGMAVPVFPLVGVFAVPHS